MNTFYKTNELTKTLAVKIIGYKKERGMDIGVLKTEFCNRYGDGAVRVFVAPGRINIIGEHIDYNGGRVLPAAIDKSLYIAIRRRDDDKITYQDLHFPGVYKFNITDSFAYNKDCGYANYLNGILSILRGMGKAVTNGFDILITSELPAGSGVSSSSALECCFTWAVNILFELGLSKLDVALIGQKSEHDFLNVQCGVMDQFVISSARHGSAILLDCYTLDYEYIPLDLQDCSFVVMDTKHPRSLATSDYNKRAAECERAMRFMQDTKIDLGGVNISDVHKLCMLTSTQFDMCKSVITDEICLRRATHCITESDRVTRSVEALKNRDLVTLGKLLNESHNSLKYDFEVTGKELDSIVSAAQKCDGCLGARMVGAGFGGCAIALVKTATLDAFIQKTGDEYEKAVGYKGAFFACKSADGVHEA